MISILLLLVAAFAVGTEASCDADSREMYEQSADFLNCIGHDVISKFIRKFDKSKNPGRFVDREMERVSNIFDKYNCIDPTIFGDNFERGLKNFGTPDEVIALVPDLRNLIWNISASPVVSECILEDFRAHFLEYLGDCSDMSIPVAKGVRYSNSGGRIPEKSFNTGRPSEHTLKAFPVASPRNTDFYELRRSTEFTILTFMSLAHCSKDEDIDEIWGKLLHEQLGDMCNCVDNSFLCDCKKQFVGRCRKLQGCLQKLTDDFSEVFDQETFIRHSTYCVKTFEPEKRRAEDLVKVGARFGSNLKKLSKRDSEAFETLIEGTFKSLFRSEFCSQCSSRLGSCRN